jgi:predicted nucleotidyltransferase
VKTSLKNSGLSSETIKKIHQVFNMHPEIYHVLLYGSRAKGNYRLGSDIDLTVMGDECSATQLLKIENQLDDLLLPYMIDISLFREIESVDLINHIERISIDFYTENQNKKPIEQNLIF